MPVPKDDFGLVRTRQFVRDRAAAEGYERYWLVDDVYTNGEQGDHVNPINLSGDVYGIWDPGETIKILVYTENVVTGYKYIQFAMPFGTVIGTSMV